MKALVVSLGLLLFVLFAPTSAHAKGIPLIYNTGDHAFPTGPLPAPLDKDPELAGYEAGYLCQIKGVLWSYFSVSECKPVVFKGDTYIDDAEVVKAITAKYTEADMKRGLWDHYGYILLALGVLAGLAIWLKEKFTGGDEASAEQPDKAA
jgi:hypothetical protein